MSDDAVGWLPREHTQSENAGFHFHAQQCSRGNKLELQLGWSMETTLQRRAGVVLNWSTQAKKV